MNRRKERYVGLQHINEPCCLLPACRIFHRESWAPPLANTPAHLRHPPSQKVILPAYGKLLALISVLARCFVYTTRGGNSSNRQPSYHSRTSHMLLGWKSDALRVLGQSLPNSNMLAASGKQSSRPVPTFITLFDLLWSGSHTRAGLAGLGVVG